MDLNPSQETETRINPDLFSLAEQQARFYKVLSNPRRLLILWLLADREMPVHEIASAAETSLQNTSQHLHLMQDLGILASRREAQTIYFRIADVEKVSNCLCAFRSITVEGQLENRYRS